MQTFWNDIFNFSESLATKVGATLQADFGQVDGIEKQDGSLVTQADQKADRQIREAIQSTFPEHGIITEEAEQAIFPKNEWCWVVDPLDGTNNFACGLPIWGISLGLLFQGTPVFGYLSFPALQQNYHGFYCNLHELQTPNGAFLNGIPIVSRKEQLGKNEFFTLCSRSMESLKTGFPWKIRSFGSSAYEYALVASGKTLGAVTATPKVWDLAGAYPVVQATGACWHALANPLFPLKQGHDYLHDSFPYFVVAKAELKEPFQKYIDF